MTQSASDNTITLTVKAIADFLNARVVGDENIKISTVNALTEARSGEISFLSDKKLLKQLDTTKASAVLISETNAENCPVTAIIVDKPYVAYARVTALLYPAFKNAQGIHPSAVIDPTASVDKSAWIGPCSVIEANATIAAGVQIGAGCVIGRGSQIGKDSQLAGNVSVMHHCFIGERALIHSGVVIGADGFGQADAGDHWVKIPQLGRVIIGNDVEIGANSCVDRGAIKDTIIGDGCRLDNMIQIAHNVHVGAHSVIAAQSGIAGSTTIGQHCIIAGHVGIAGHITITNNVVLAGGAMARQDIKEPGVYASGSPLEPIKSWYKNSARIKQLDEIGKRIRQLEKKLAQLEDPASN
ncbi:MAG: UDP-3-O-(3-hydroxymyristoyl)glucosamine N-acyltransferase [Gammaproteobacteria bacterium]|nr:UDP-3-O-(3-hydroxymyristoyl)glucosamine N-acyltransferase [Gammaproteobacteria bacterium]